MYIYIYIYIYTSLPLSLYIYIYMFYRPSSHTGALRPQRLTACEERSGKVCKHALVRAENGYNS